MSGLSFIKYNRPKNHIKLAVEASTDIGVGH
ncbi:hypothetical protein Niako_5684 [Niastella koreensis GR20-10]|uniref:Uncharacterized protein n=1 Tax=Niastella koreensis (strain DSM 17620 / KACC 11465 / NBRC 106392 / GR20-10) TaxID=700598 RepID=G8TL75_NIAKG|nr:hypothetical protein Niako_5684 [Niastella koreensis GR20-10]